MIYNKVFFFVLSILFFSGCNKTFVVDEFPTIRYESISSGTSNTLRSVCFINSTEGFAGGDAGTILQTTNGGTSWTSIPFSTSQNIYKVLFLNSSAGFVGTDNGLFRTASGGATWSGNILPFSQSAKIQDIFFIGSRGYACGIGSSSGVVYKTNNGGTSWTKLTFPSGPNLGPYFKTLFFFTPDTGYAAGADLDYASTTDGGLTWSGSYDVLGQNTVTPDFNKIYYLSLNDGYAVGEGGKLLRTDWPPTNDFDNLKPNDWERNLYGFAIRGSKAIAVGQWSV